MSIAPSTPSTGNTAARSEDRAVLLWGLATTIIATQALVDGSNFATSVAALFLPLVPKTIPILNRIILVAAALCVVILGATLLLIAVPAALVLSRIGGIAATSAVTLTSATFLSHHFQTIPDLSGLSIHAGSAFCLLLPVLVAAIIFTAVVPSRSIVHLVAGSLVAIVALDLAGARWITFETYGSPIFRMIFVLLPLASVLPTLSIRKPAFPSLSPIWLGIGIIVGAVASAALPKSPISSIVFDESHGRWETVVASFGPNDFGRGANYTYRLLFDYSAKLVNRATIFKNEDDSMPGTDAVFVLKMPSSPLSQKFSDRLEQWVRNGGRLLVIADHTDLYDSTQNLNAFLNSKFGIRINADAVFDAKGKPTVPTTERLAAVLGHINATSQPWAWQTGASFSSLPWDAVELAKFGLSFAEPGDYSRPNRFGPFLPRTSLRYGNHSAVLGLSAGFGAIVVVLDSTPWSNFSIFVEQYKHLFRAIISTLSHPLTLRLWGWSVALLGLLTVSLLVFRHPALFAATGLVLGVTLGSALQIGLASSDVPKEGRDFRLRIVSGASAKFEFLRQLLAPGERNFARIQSATAKYGLDPSSSRPGLEIPKLLESTKWLLIQPDRRQLPDPDALIAHLRNGRDLTIMFGPEQAADAEIRAWLEALGLVTQRSIGLALAEDSRSGGLMNRRGPAMLRDLRTTTSAIQTSLLKERDGDQFFQSYTARPTTFPRTSGLFNVGFSADQFSDDAVGEIWEGVYPSALGKLREAQLAAVLEGRDLPAPMPNGVVAFSDTPAQSRLEKYLLMIDGQTILSGTFPSGKRTEATTLPAPIDEPVEYLRTLHSRALALIESRCPKSAKITICETRILGPDMVEWMVSWAEDDTGHIQAVELLHERRFSGVGATLNVVFGN